MEIVHRTGQMLGSFEFAFCERLVNDHLRRDVCEFTALPRFHLLAHGARSCVASGPAAVGTVALNVPSGFRLTFNPLCAESSTAVSGYPVGSRSLPRTPGLAMLSFVASLEA